MRAKVAILLALSPACFVGLPDDGGGDGSVGTDGSDSGASDQSGSAGSVSTSASGTASSSASDTGASTTQGSTATTDPGDATDPTATTATTDPTADSGESTGGMSGCEGGPLAAPIPGCTPQPVPNSGDFYQDCVDRINQFRWECQCLPPLARWASAEACTDNQSAADQASNSPHGNFGSCGEYAQNTCPNWGSQDDIIGGCLQAMWDEGPGEPFSQHGHYLNMSSTEFTQVACGYSSGPNGVWSNQNFN
jgi:hypothetical protein